jgi:hypothetical protein
VAALAVTRKMGIISPSRQKQKLDPHLSSGGKNMNELVKLISKKTGLNAAMAQVAITLVIDYLKQKLPPAVGKQIDFFLANEDSVVAAGKMAEDLIGAVKKNAATKKKK